jgi:hypothetical protein
VGSNLVPTGHSCLDCSRHAYFGQQHHRPYTDFFFVINIFPLSKKHHSSSRHGTDITAEKSMLQKRSLRRVPSKANVPGYEPVGQLRDAVRRNEDGDGGDKHEKHATAR